LRELGGRGYFTKELEEALMGRRIDLAVHSFKDVPSENPEGLTIACVSAREDPADLLIINMSSYSPDMGKIPVSENAIIGTSAVRRESQLRALRKDLKIKDLRGNVPTRLRKLSEGQYDGIFLAAAGVKRLNLLLDEFEVIRLDPEDFVPSPGQGVLALQMRVADPDLESVKNIIHDDVSFTATSIEREVMTMFGGGCGLPLGAYAYKYDDVWRVHGFWGGTENKPKWARAESKKPSELAGRLYDGLRDD
jgi:hydroxymethylbilane synthase